MSDSQSQQPDEFPVPFAVFAAALKGTHEEVYTKLLRITHGDRPRLPSEWRERLRSLRNLPTS